MGFGQPFKLDPTHFPNCVSAVHTSNPDPRQNCIAHAFEVVDQWWWWQKPGIWPTAAPREGTIRAFEMLLRHKGFQPGATDTIEDGLVKIAMYTIGDAPKHMARQIASGRWSSKMGRNVDIEHSLSDLEGPYYGRVHGIYSRQTT